VCSQPVSVGNLAAPYIPSPEYAGIGSPEPLATAGGGRVAEYTAGGGTPYGPGRGETGPGAHGPLYSAGGEIWVYSAGGEIWGLGGKLIGLGAVTITGGTW
jgi:hypothetical protein